MNFDNARRPQNFANTYLKIANIATDREAEDEISRFYQRVSL